MTERAKERRRLEREYLRRQYEMYDESAQAPTALDELRQARFMSFIKWSLAMVGVAMLLFASLTLFALIVIPAWFRGLPANEQVIWINRVPLFEALRPTRVYSLDTLPTANPNPDAALALLGGDSTPLAVTESALENPLLTGQDGGAQETPGGVIVPPPSVTPTPTLPFTSRITPMLATNTPVIAALAASPTPPPTASAALPTATPYPTLPPPPPPTPIPIPVAYQASGYRFEKQKWNTCGPANLTQTLHYLGWGGTQQDVTNFLKPKELDRNVSPWELVNYVNESVYAQQGVPLKSLMRVGGTLEIVKRLVANGFGVIIEKGYNLAEEGWLGHYLTIQGYDDSRGEIHGLDTYLGDRWEPYDELDTRWQQFNRVFIVIYPADRERELALALGNHRDVNYAIQFALSRAKEEASIQPDNPYAWFNIGSAYALQGEYKKAVTAFDQARSVGVMLPWRFLWYQFGPYEAYYNAGYYSEVLNLTQATLNTSPDLEESHYWRGMALAATGDLEGAKQAFRRALNLNPRSTLAAQRIAQIENGTFAPPKTG